MWTAQDACRPSTGTPVPYLQLIKEFQNLTGVPVLVSTAFDGGELIACKPEEVLAFLLRNKLDAFVIGNDLITKDKQ